MHVKLNLTEAGATTARLSLGGTTVQVETQVSGDINEVVLDVSNPTLWSPNTPHLYDLTVELMRQGTVYDRYALPIGIREIKVDGDALLLNGQPIYLQSFGRREAGRRRGII